MIKIVTDSSLYLLTERIIVNDRREILWLFLFLVVLARTHAF